MSVVPEAVSKDSVHTLLRLKFSPVVIRNSQFHLKKPFKYNNAFSQIELIPMGSVATAGFDGRLGLLSPLALIAVILCSYSKPSISSVDLYLVMVTGFLLARTHLSDRTSLRSMMYPETSRPPSSSGGFQATVIPSRETSKMVGRPGGPGTSVEEGKTCYIILS